MLSPREQAWLQGHTFSLNIGRDVLTHSFPGIFWALTHLFPYSGEMLCTSFCIILHRKFLFLIKSRVHKMQAPSDNLKHKTRHVYYDSTFQQQGNKKSIRLSLLFFTIFKYLFSWIFIFLVSLQHTCNTHEDMLYSSIHFGWTTTTKQWTFIYTNKYFYATNVVIFILLAL